MFYTQHFKCPPDAHAKCLVLFLFGKIDAVEPFRLAAALKTAWVGAEVSRGSAGQPFCQPGGWAPLSLPLAPVWRLSQSQELDAATETMGHVSGTGHNAASSQRI